MSLATRALLILASSTFWTIWTATWWPPWESGEGRSAPERQGFRIFGHRLFPGVLLTSPLFGYLGDRSAAAASWPGAGVWSLATSLTFWVPSYPFLVAARGLVGVGEASFGTLAPAYLADLLPMTRRSWVLGLFYWPCRWAPPWLTWWGGCWAATWGWRPAFLVAGLPGLVMAGLIYRLGRFSPSPRPRRRPRTWGPPDRVLASF